MVARVANLESEHFFQQLITDGLLKVTKAGRVFDLRRNVELAPYKEDSKYRRISWGPRGNVRKIQVHRLVWGTFKGVPTDATLVINHKNGKPGICALRNLELVSDGRNKLHAYAMGLTAAKPQRGSKNGNAKFTDSEVRKYRKLYAAGKITQRQIYEAKGVSQTIVSAMLLGQTYTEV